MKRVSDVLCFTGKRTAIYNLTVNTDPTCFVGDEGV